VSGIDNQKDRDSISYHPNLEYVKPTIYASDYTPSKTDTNSATIITVPSLKDLWTDTVSILDTLSNLEQSLSTKLKDVTAISSSTNVAQAAQAFGDTNFNGTISFPLYKAALQSPDSYEKNIIVDAFENYHIDVNGKLNAEIYTDVVDMIADWQNTISFINRGLFTQIVPTNQVPSTTNITDPAIDVVHTAELALINSFTKQTSDRIDSLSTMRQEYLTDSKSEAYYASQAHYKNVNDLHKDLYRRVNTKAEVTSLVTSKVVDSQVVINFITQLVDYRPYQDNVHDVLYGLLSQYTTRQSMEKGLRKIQALLKLSIDGKVENINEAKANLRGIANLSTKVKMNNSLINGIYLKNEVYGDVNDFMQGIESYPASTHFDTAASHIVDSITRANDLYTNQSADFYKIHSLDGELRKNKLKGLVDKDTAREIYRLCDLIIAYATNKNSWPEQSNLSQWLSDFLKSENIS
jgi:hypothetical protein